MESSPHYAIVSRETAPNGILVSVRSHSIPAQFHASFPSSVPLCVVFIPVLHDFILPQALLYSHLELVLVDADWLTARLKTCLATDPKEDILGWHDHSNRFYLFDDS